MNAFAWTIALFPVYLVIHGKLANYAALAAGPVTP